MFERELVVGGETGRSGALTHGKNCALDLHIISHHVTMLDRDGGVRIHMEFVGCDRAAARNGKRVSDNRATPLARSGSAEDACVGTIRTPLP